MSERIRIVIADDHAPTRAGIRGVLEADGFEVCGEAAGADAAVELALAERPAVCLLDINMPGGGIAAAGAISERLPETAIVMLTVSRDDADLFDALRAGAAGYLLKSEPPERIALFLRGVAHGEAALSGAVARRLLDRVREGGRMGGIPDEVAQKLSAREVEVLLLLDEHLGTDEIAARLYISEHTVRSHVKSLLRKLGVSSRRDALERLATARR